MEIRKIAAAVALGVLALGSAQAKEGGDQYPNGAETWLAGAVPPPGNYFINYFGYYSGDLVDGDGKRVRGAGVDAWFDALRCASCRPPSTRSSVPTGAGTSSCRWCIRT